MKKIIFLGASLIVALSLGISCNKSDEVTDPQPPEAILEPVIFNFTGTWDSQCGQLSRSAMDSIRLQFPATPVINVHMSGPGGVLSDPLSNSRSEALARFFNVYPNDDSTYNIPFCWFMCPAVIGGFNYSSNVYQDLSVSVEWAKDNLDPALALDIQPELTGNQINVVISTEAVQNMPMEVFLSVYLTEDEVHAEQVDDQGLSHNIHHDVFRACLNEFNGDKIANVVHVGEKNEYQYSGILEQGWDRNKMKVTVIVWYKDSVYGNLVHLGKRVNLLP